MQEIGPSPEHTKGIPLHTFQKKRKKKKKLPEKKKKKGAQVFVEEKRGVPSPLSFLGKREGEKKEKGPRRKKKKKWETSISYKKRRGGKGRPERRVKGRNKATWNCARGRRKGEKIVELARKKKKKGEKEVGLDEKKKTLRNPPKEEGNSSSPRGKKRKRKGESEWKGSTIGA